MEQLKIAQKRQENYECARKEIGKYTDKSLTQKDIKIIHTLIMGLGSEQSNYRVGWGAPPVQKNGKSIYSPPDSALYSIPDEVEKLLDWYNNNSIDIAIEIAARMHWGFVKIHPFDNGNGRTARLLVSLILLSRGHSDVECRRLEEYLTSDTTKYYEALDDNFSYLGFDRVTQKWINYLDNAFECCKI